METVLKVIAGAAAGAVLGFIFSRAKVCSSGACSGRINAAFSMIAWAVFAAAVTWYFIRR